MSYTAAVITVSDKGFQGLRQDTSGPALCSLLTQNGYQVIYTAIVPDEQRSICEKLLLCADQLKVNLVLTTGGTGFSPRDITPEATKSILERETPGLPELMRAESLKLTNRACLSRSAAGIRGKTLILNLPGSEKAARENFLFVLSPLSHGLDMLLSGGSADCAGPEPVVLAVCLSEKKGQQKHPVAQAELKKDWGILGDAHAGPWRRQVSLLGAESVAKVQEHISFPLLPGAFAENILTQGICLYQLPVGTRLQIGQALCQVTQIGKECHSDCAIRKAAGDCVMPREGIFVQVLEEGLVKAGDPILVR